LLIGGVLLFIIFTEARVFH